ncbi:DUF3048-like lipoprotein [Pontimonas salivibrio]|uniref:DUF3048-like lipoprotein n=1 Tax=Pontimonas salivibrio TaxID=1159327 RepID=A0A2L2BSK2_9MICO|nr:DUF3048 C-terminal domain-containing protein [Pontimonas salivibrio]AVG24646.1 DUF3048-like lipoprotein [Pontimonas salivibrio]
MNRVALRRFVALSVVAALTLVGCARPDEPVEVEESAPAEEQVEEVIEPPRHPLTGEEVVEGSVTGPAVMAKIDHENRPYVNLHRADIVIQQLIPQNGTRFIAIFHSDVPDQIGYVRSFRPHDLYMASPFQGLLASSGMFALVVPFWEDTEAAGVRQYVWDYRTAEDRDLWSTVDKNYAMASSVLFAAADAQAANATLAPPQQYFEYVSDPAEASAAAGTPVSNFTTYFSESATNDYVTSVWEWNATTGFFEKNFINGDPVSVESGEQLAVTNLVAISVEHDDFVGQPTARMLNGGGSAWVATGGKVIEADWEGGALTEPITLTSGGEPVKLAPGKTWFMIFPGDASTARTAAWGGPGSVSYE